MRTRAATWLSVPVPPLEKLMAGVMLALKSGVVAGDAVHEALVAGDLSPERFAAYGAQMRLGIENI